MDGRDGTRGERQLPSLPSVVCLGEALIDLLAPTGVVLKDAPTFTRAPGGAPLPLRLGQPERRAGALAATRHGVIPALPTRAEVERFLGDS